MVKRQIIFASLKGGVGKSFCTRTFVDLARRSGRTVSAWDLDGGTGSLARRYADRRPEVGVATENVRDDRAPGGWIDALFGAADDVVLDVPGGALGDLLRVLDGGAASLVAQAREADRELVLVSVIGTDPDATETPQEAIERFGPDVHHVVLKNGLFGEREDFVVYDGYTDEVTGVSEYEGVTGQMVRDAGGEVVYLPRLNGRTSALLALKNLTFVEGAEAVSTLGRRHAFNTRAWLELAVAEFAGTWIATDGATPTPKLSLLKRPRAASVSA